MESRGASPSEERARAGLTGPAPIVWTVDDPSTRSAAPTAPAARASTCPPTGVEVVRAAAHGAAAGGAVRGARSGRGSSARCGGSARPRRQAAVRLTDGGVGAVPGPRAGPLRVRVEPGRSAAARRAPRATRLHVEVGAARAASRSAHALEAWYRRRARAEVAPRLDAACARAGTRYTRLSIRAPAHALGELLLRGRDELQLAAAARARGDPRLRGGARGGAPRGARPLARASGACSAARSPRLPRARALAAPQRARRCGCSLASATTPSGSSAAPGRSRRRTRRPARPGASTWWPGRRRSRSTPRSPSITCLQRQHPRDARRARRGRCFGVVEVPEMKISGRKTAFT